MKVKDVMFRDLTAVSADTDLNEAVESLSRHRVSGVPVVDGDGRVVGFLSEKDVIKTAYPYPEGRGDDLMITARLSDLVRELGRIKERTVGSCMTKPAVTALEDEDIEDVITKMLKNDLKIMPVVRDERLVGTVRRRDLAATIVKEGEAD